MTEDDVEQVFVRRDGFSRQHDERWFDYAVGDWVTWQEALRRGADPARPLAA